MCDVLCVLVVVFDLVGQRTHRFTCPGLTSADGSPVTIREVPCSTPEFNPEQR